MRETGGRAVERKLDIGVKPEGDLIGLDPQFDGDSVAQGGTAGFKLIAVDAEGKRKDAKGLVWSLVRIERNYQWYRNGSYWNYEPVTFTRAVANGTIDASTGAEAELKLPVDWGRYRLEVETADPDGPATSYEFDAGWYVSASSTETPDALEIALDKDEYSAGDVARLQVSPRFAGELLVTVGADRLLTTVTATIPEGGATVDIPVGADWGAGAYVTATLYRPGESRESRMPARAIGVKWLKVDPGAKKLAVALATVDKTQPRGPLSIPVTVSGLPAMTDAYVTVAAVDVGILNLTNYKAPDPEGWYFGQRRMGIELRDLYGLLIDGSLGATGRLRTGGDGAMMATQGNPPKEKLVAFFTGPVKLDADGKATITFDLPQFNGTVRVMAVAWTKEAVGHATSDVIVRDPIVLTAGLPRFMAPGDEARMTLDIANTDAPAGDYTLTLEGDDRTRGEAGGGAREADARTRQAPDADRPADGDEHRRRRPDHHARQRRRRHRRAGARPADPPGGDARHHPFGGAACGQWRQPDSGPRTARGEPDRGFAGLAQRLAERRLRRRVAADDARPLSLWLRRADHQPGAASALSQRAVARLRPA